jgi:hypothetical protein
MLGFILGYLCARVTLQPRPGRGKIRGGFLVEDGQHFGGFLMSRLWLGTICGLVYGALSAASMLPLSFEDKSAALAGAFLNRFAIGFVIGAARLPLPGWAQGLIFGILLSLPDAIITKAYAPILLLGAVGGVVIGFIVGRWGA